MLFPDKNIKATLLALKVLKNENSSREAIKNEIQLTFRSTDLFSFPVDRFDGNLMIHQDSTIALNNFIPIFFNL